MGQFDHQQRLSTDVQFQVMESTGEKVSQNNRTESQGWDGVTPQNSHLVSSPMEVHSQVRAQLPNKHRNRCERTAVVDALGGGKWI